MTERAEQGDAGVLLWHMREAWKDIGETPEEAEGKSFFEMVIARYAAQTARLASAEAALRRIDRGEGVPDDILTLPYEEFHREFGEHLQGIARAYFAAYPEAGP